MKERGGRSMNRGARAVAGTWACAGANFGGSMVEASPGEGATAPVSVAARGYVVRTCQWPLWAHHERAGHPQRFCGAPTADNRSYCDEHRSKAFTHPAAWNERMGVS